MVQKHTNRPSWEDLEAILLVGRAGSVRRAANVAGVAHKTLANRVAAAERALGIVAFVRSASGYTPTKAGFLVMDHAERMEQEATAMSLQVAGTDQQVKGRVRVSVMTPVLCQFLAPQLDRFSLQFPNISIEFKISTRVTDLNQHKAEVAIRFQDMPDPELVGRRVGAIFDAPYATRDFAHAFNRTDGPVPVIGWTEDEIVRDRATRFGLDDIEIRFIANEPLAQRALALNGDCLAFLPTFVGDPTPELVRVENREPLRICDAWVLTHPDLKESARVQAVARFCSATLQRELSTFAEE